MEILDCIVIEVKEDVIKLIANDLEIGIETTIEGRIIEEGSVAAGAKVLSEIAQATKQRLTIQFTPVF